MSDCFYKTRDLRHFYRPEQNYSGSWVTRPLLLTASSTRISSYGSCFAGRIAQRLRKHPDFIYIRYGQQEYPDSVLNEFSAPVGNVYSVAQFDSLLRAVVEPIDISTFIHAHPTKGRYLPIIPRLGYFENEAEAAQSFSLSLESFKNSLIKSDLLVFTVGLSEVWLDIENDSYLPISPGCGYGSSDGLRFVPRQLTSIDIRFFLTAIKEKLKFLNPSLKVILTLSPIPLVATHTTENAITANCVSKFTQYVALREWLIEVGETSDFYYFPSFEIVTNPMFLSKFFQSDYRSVTQAAEDAVMREFFGSFLKIHESSFAAHGSARADSQPAATSESNPRDSVGGSLDICDEDIYWKMRL